MPCKRPEVDHRRQRPRPRPPRERDADPGFHPRSCRRERPHRARHGDCQSPTPPDHAPTERTRAQGLSSSSAKRRGRNIRWCCPIRIPPVQIIRLFSHRSGFRTTPPVDSEFYDAPVAPAHSIGNMTYRVPSLIQSRTGQRCATLIAEVFSRDEPVAVATPDRPMTELDSIAAWDGAICDRWNNRTRSGPGMVPSVSAGCRTVDAPSPGCPPTAPGACPRTTARSAPCIGANWKPGSKPGPKIGAARPACTSTCWLSAEGISAGIAIAEHLVNSLYRIRRNARISGRSSATPQTRHHSGCSAKAGFCQAHRAALRRFRLRRTPAVSADIDTAPRHCAVCGARV